MIEIIGGMGFMLIIAGKAFLDFKQDSKEANTLLESHFNRPYLLEANEVKPPETNPAIDLVVELLRANEGWTSKRKMYDLYVYTHETGVSLKESKTGVSAEIQDENGYFKPIDATTEESKKLVTELAAFKTRERDREQRALAKALAKRVAARESGEVLPVLGEPGVSGNADELVDSQDSVDSERTEPDALSARYLVREGDKIIYVGPEDSKRMKLSEELRKYYGI
jgi:hypothetical protein